MNKTLPHNKSCCFMCGGYFDESESKRIKVMGLMNSAKVCKPCYELLLKDSPSIYSPSGDEPLVEKEV